MKTQSDIDKEPVILNIQKYSKILTLFTNSFFTNTISKINNDPNNLLEGNLEIFKENFDMLNTELLKNEDNNNIIGKIKKNSEYIFASRISSSKYEIINQQKLFYDNLKKFSFNISYIANLQKEMVLDFRTKDAYVKFNFKYCNEKFLSQKHFLRVSKLL